MTMNKLTESQHIYRSAAVRDEPHALATLITFML